MKRSLACLVALTFLTACSGGSDVTGGSPDAPDSTPPPATSSGETGEVRPPHRVVVISVDGLNPDALSSRGALPSFTYLARAGASTLNARTTWEQTSTLPNHTSMMTGVRVGGDVGHGVSFNADTGADVHSSAGRYVPGIFDVAHDRGLSTALYTSKDKFLVLHRSWDGSNGAPDTVGADNGRDKIDTFVLAAPPELVRRVREDLVTDGTDLTFLHLALPDSAGHDEGFMSKEYLEAVERTDALVGDVLRVVREDAALRRNTVVLLTADHGGSGPDGHSESDERVNYTVPFFAWGKGVARGADLYDLNPAREDPGTGRPNYAGEQPIRNLDVANLSLSLLGLPLLEEDLLAPPLDLS